MLEITKIHEDERGEIYSLPLKNEEETALFTTKKGYARGGCIHEINDEYLVIINGRVNFLLGDKWLTLQKGMSMFIPHGTPHMFIAEEDSITIEWGVTKAEKEKKEPTMRKYVETINKQVKENE
jgi:mannose-6-phosphate isomerase-like protein (cupin superfamily)